MSVADPLFPRDRKRYVSEITFLQIERLREVKYNKAQWIFRDSWYLGMSVKVVD